jgi:rubrerythrin
MTEPLVQDVSSKKWSDSGRGRARWRFSNETGQQFPADRAILNVALGLEHQAIAAYQAGAKSGLLSGSALDMAVSFMRDHERHRDTITRFLGRFGGSPVLPRTDYDFGTIKAAGDILTLAHRLEQGAADAYLANAGKLESAEVLDAAAGILIDEVRHATAFKLALSLPITVRPKY